MHHLATFILGERDAILLMVLAVERQLPGELSYLFASPSLLLNLALQPLGMSLLFQVLQSQRMTSEWLSYMAEVCLV